MLAYSPDFTKWDEAVAQKYNIKVGKGEDSNPDWEDILEEACSADKYLEQHFNDIRSLFLLIQHTIEKAKVQDATFEELIRSIIDKSSVTGVSEPVAAGEFDKKRMIGKLHEAVYRSIREKRGDIEEIRIKNNTGNGGFFLSLPEEGSVEVKLRPKALPDKIACEILLSTKVKRPEDLVGKSFEEILENPTAARMFADFDKLVAPLLGNKRYFEGNPYSENGKYFESLTDEMAFIYHKGWIDPHDLCLNVSYWIKCNSESLFEDKDVVEAIADVVIANYDWRFTSLALHPLR